MILQPKKMKALFKLNHCSLLLSIMLVSACGTPGLLKNTDQKLLRKQNELKMNEANYSARPLPLLEKQTGAWLTNRSVPIEDTVHLPPLFEQPAAFLSGHTLTMANLAEILTKEYGIFIRLSADIFNQMPAGERSSRGSGGGGNYGSGPSSGYQNKNEVSDGPSVRLHYQGNLRGLLDMVANKTMTHWTYQAGVVEFARTQTRTFEINTMPGRSVYSANAGKTSNSTATDSAEGGGGAQLGYNSSTTITTTSNLNYWEQMVKAVESMLSPAGVVMPSEMTNSITVTDNMETVEKVRRFVASENAALSRQVKLDVQVYAVKLNEQSASGIDWELVARGIQGATFGAAGMTMPTTLTSVGRVGVGINSGFLQGSRAIINALSKQGRVSTVVNTNVVTLNNQPAPVAVTENQAYVSKISSVLGTAVTVGTVTMEQSNLSTGFIINLLPTLLNNRSVMLQAQIDLSYLNELKPYSLAPEEKSNDKNKSSSGKSKSKKEGEKEGIERPNESKDQGASLTRVQLPHTSSIQTMQRASLKSGETLVLSGFRRTRYETARDGIFAYQGGTKSASQMVEEIIVVISPHLTEGA